jgi:predicted alpha-1,2-mannosidase
MVSRRKFMAVGSAMLLGREGLRAAFAQPIQSGSESAAPSEGVSRFVNIRIGTGGHGHCYPGATVPFGMVQLSPDTYNRGWDWCSGYNDSDDSIMGFSHTHLSGTGIGDMLDFLIMACTGPVKTDPGTRENPGAGYRSRFSHRDEKAVPGYYSVLLRDYGIHAELSSATRAGIHRYTFPENKSSYFILDLDHGYDDGAGVVRWADLKVVGNDTIVGGKSTNRWAKGREIYFAMKFSRPFDRLEILAEGQPLPRASKEVRGKSIKAILHYATKDQEAILIKTGISGVSAEGALRNLDADIPAWDFDGIRTNAAALWEKELSRVQAEGGTQKQREIFYTALYHCFLAPTIFDDVDGSYRGMDGVNHKLPPGSHNYSTFSLWDTYRAAHPLFTIVQPERVPDLANCLIRMAKESPVGMPIWPLQAKETQCMTGYHSATVIAEAIQKGFAGIDVNEAYAVMNKVASQSEIRGLPLYRKHGYIPCDLYAQSVSTTLDYAYNDWATSSVAKAAGLHAEAEDFRRRSLNYKNMYDKTTGFMRPRLEDGSWALPFAENEMGHSKKWRDYTESNPWQATFAVQHDPQGLAELMGGRKKLVEKLDGIFTANSALPPDAPNDIAGMVGQYAHGNEPSHHIAYLYVYAGAAHKTQERVSSLMETMYDNQPNGLAGNEDCGQMSAWYVMSAMGFYAVDPISGNYVFGTPLFDKVTIDMGRGRQFVLQAQRRSPSDKYIESIERDASHYDKAWFTHRDLASGGTFVLRMSNQPNIDFGSQSHQLPLSVSS